MVVLRSYINDIKSLIPRIREPSNNTDIYISFLNGNVIYIEKQFKLLCRRKGKDDLPPIKQEFNNLMSSIVHGLVLKDIVAIYQRLQLMENTIGFCDKLENKFTIFMNSDRCGLQTNIIDDNIIAQIRYHEEALFRLMFHEEISRVSPSVLSAYNRLTNNSLDSCIGQLLSCKSRVISNLAHLRITYHGVKAEV